MGTATDFQMKVGTGGVKEYLSNWSVTYGADGDGISEERV